MIMKLYLVERTDKIGWDEYDSFVCVADSEESARQINPIDSYSEWTGESWDADGFDWVNPSTLKITEIGLAKEGLANGNIILSSFNAG